MLSMQEALAADQQKPAIVPIKFWKDHEPIAGGTELKEVEWVEYAKKGSNGATTQEKIARLSKAAKDGRTSPVWQVIEPYYEHWKKGQDEPTSGTSLDAWPAITPGQAAQYRLLHLRSVEDVSQMTDNDCDRFGMGARGLRDKARAFVQAKGGQAAMADELSKRDETIANLTTQIADLTASVQALTADRVQRDKPADVSKRKNS